MSYSVDLMPAAHSTLSKERDVGSLPAVNLGGVRVHAVTEQDAKDWMRGASRARTGETRFVATVNLDHLALARRDPEFRSCLNQADLALADGVGVVLLSSVDGRRLPARVAGSDLTAWLVRGGLGDVALYLLGSTWDVLRTVRLEAERHGVRVVGASAPARAAVESATASREVVEHIRRSRADVLLVAFGAPRQEKWITRWRSELGVPIAMGVGGSLDFIAGRQKRAPVRLQRMGLEWAYRMVTEPGRLARRCLVVDTPYLARETIRIRRAQRRGSKRPDATGRESTRSGDLFPLCSSTDMGGDSS
jgi:N-acetylglucosaminyldiphosphoundecaprenol N-acetyl-beta-D-mannosaminyltransferase